MSGALLHPGWLYYHHPGIPERYQIIVRGLPGMIRRRESPVNALAKVEHSCYNICR